MNRLPLAVSLFTLLAASPAFADTLFNFTLTGGGHTFQFTDTNPPTTVDNPHLVYAQLPTATGTVDGVSGYTFSGIFVVLGNTGFLPVLDLQVSPDAPGVTSPYYMGEDTYMLNGPTFTTMTSDVANPMPSCSLGVCNDLLTFAFVPEQYSLSGYDPDHNQGSYTLDISASNSATVTPEPPALLLLLTGCAATGIAALRRRRSVAAALPPG